MRFRYPPALLLIALLSGPAAHAAVHHHVRDAGRHAKPLPKTVAKVAAKSSEPAHNRQRGRASYYAQMLAGRKMADGTRLDLASNAAASKTLPLGTRARVKNLENGRMAVVEIRDRGPFAAGRIIDLTPRTAKLLGLRGDGLLLVEVEPIRFPASD